MRRKNMVKPHWGRAAEAERVMALNRNLPSAGAGPFPVNDEDVPMSPSPVFDPKKSKRDTTGILLTDNRMERPIAAADRHGAAIRSPIPWRRWSAIPPRTGLSADTTPPPSSLSHRCSGPTPCSKTAATSHGMDTMVYGVGDRTGKLNRSNVILPWLSLNRNSINRTMRTGLVTIHRHPGHTP